jgi:chloride channel 3/4/5
MSLPAGIILPSMTIGALYGRALGIIVQKWQHAFPDAWMFSSCKVGEECVSPGLYAIAGAASALAGVTRLTGITFRSELTTVSLVVIMFELTGALPFVLPIMIAVMLAKQVADMFGKRGIYETWIHLNGYPYLDKVEDYSREIGVREVMTKIQDLVVITAVGQTIDSLSIISPKIG